MLSVKFVAQDKLYNHKSGTHFTDMLRSHNQNLVEIKLLLYEELKSEAFDSCNRSNNLAQIGFKLSIFWPVWPWNLMDDLKNNGVPPLCYAKLCAPFQSHWLVQTGFTVQKHSIRWKFAIFCHVWPWDLMDNDNWVAVTCATLWTDLIIRIKNKAKLDLTKTPRFWIYSCKIITCKTTSHASDHPVKYDKNSSRTANGIQWTQEDVQYSRSFYCKIMTEWPWRYQSRSKVTEHDTSLHYSDHLC